MRPKYLALAEHYDRCFHRFGDSHRGVDWPSDVDATTRHRIMAEFIGNDAPSVLDFGCGAGHFLDYLILNNYDVEYWGLDVNTSYVHHCRNKYHDQSNANFILGDVIENPGLVPLIDFVVANGTFTEKLVLSDDEMWAFMQKCISPLWRSCRKGIAFNVMSKVVDWEREDLFHVSMDRLALYLRSDLSRNFQFRHDYGLYEFTAYVYK